MKSAGTRADIEVWCPDCEGSFEVSPLFATLAPAAEVHPKCATGNVLDRAIARWESEGGASAPSR